MADAKNTKWQVYRPEWYNERILETYISSPIIDKQNDKIGTDTIKESMDFYMKYGVYSYKHEEMPVGLPLAYKVKDGKVKIRVGVHNKLPMHDRVWEEMKIYGDKGGSSIRGEAEKQEKVCEGEVCHNNISELSLWSVSWVGNRPANPEATVTAVAAAKTEEPIKVTKQVTLDEIEGMVEKIIERRGKKYCLFAKKDRKLLGCHSTRAGAVNQERAIQARRFSKMNEELDGILDMIKKKPCETGYEMIGTKLMRGKKVPNCVPIGKAVDSVKVKAPKGHHWMAYKDGPVLMVGDYEEHVGAVEEFPFEVIEEHDESRLLKAEYQGRKVNLNKPFRLQGENKKFGVYVKNDKGNTVQVKFGDPKMDIKRDSPDKRRNFRSRHNCDSPGPKYKARYWSCKMWSSKNVSSILNKIDEHIWDIAGIRKCKVQKGIEISKAPKKKPQDYRSGGRTPKGKKPRRDPPSKTQWDNCLQNAKRLKNYQGGPMTASPERFCGALWYDYQKFGHKATGSDRAPNPPNKHPPGAGGKEPGNVQDISGYKFRTRMFDTSNYKPKTLNRRNIDDIMSGGKKGKK